MAVDTPVALGANLCVSLRGVPPIPFRRLLSALYVDFSPREEPRANSRIMCNGCKAYAAA